MKKALHTALALVPLIVLLALLLYPAIVLAGVTNNGDGTSTWWHCPPDLAVSTFDAAVQIYAEDEGSGTHALAMLVLRDQAVVTTGDGVIDTGYCGVLAVGQSEWRITIGNTGLAAFRAAYNARNGWVDVNPADGSDDNTGESANEFADRHLKEAMKGFVQRRNNLDATGPVQADDWDDDPGS